MSAEPHPEYVRGWRDAMREQGLEVFDGPGAFAALDKAQRELDAEIASAGGLEAWQALAVPVPPPAAPDGVPSTLKPNEQKE